MFSVMQTKADWSDFKPDKWHLIQLDLSSNKTTILDRGSIYADYAPDGNYLAVARLVDGQRDIWLRDKDGRWSQVTHDESRESGPEWTHDGAGLLYNGDVDGHMEILIWDRSSGEVKPVTSWAGPKPYNPQCAFNKGDILFYLEKGDGKDQIFLMSLGSGSMRNLSKNDHHEYFPRWIDDHSYFFQRGDEGVYMRRIDDPNDAVLLIPEGIFACVSPDHQRSAWFQRTVNGVELKISSWPLNAKETSVVWDASQFPSD